MKKARLMLAAAAAGILLAGCSAGGAGSFSPDRNCVYITSDRDIKSALVLETEETFDADVPRTVHAICVRTTMLSLTSV